ncbi:MAG: benzoate-CoA ligase family protein, partial [Phenylobacterium sp.]
ADVLGRNLAAGRADKAAFIDPRGSWTYGQVADRVERFGHVLRKLGVAREERILLCLLDTIDWPTAFLGAIKAGVVAIPVNTLLTEDDYRFMLADSRAKVLVVSEALYAKFAALIPSCPDLQHVIVSGDDAHGHQRFEDLLQAAGGPAYTAPTTRDDLCFWLYTSGSTGKPKGAVHIHSSLRMSSELYGGPILGLTENDLCYSVAKLFFAYGLGNALTFPMMAGATTVLLPDRPTPESVGAVLRQHPITVFYGVPTFYAAFLASPELPKRSEVRFRRCVSAGEALPTDVGRRWSEHFGCDILDGIGSTEMLHIFLSNRAGQARPGSTGVAVPGYDLRIVDDGGLEVPVGTPGTLLVRGESAATGYWSRYDASRLVFQGEWLRTGDTYVQDADGYYTCLGRTGDMLKASGMWVAPAEVEARLRAHQAVSDAAVVAARDTDGLEKPVAFVILRAGQTATETELIEFCREGLPSFKRPRKIVFVREYPTTDTGKIRRVGLRQMANDVGLLAKPPG